MAYENRESGGKNVADFEKDISDISSNTLQYSKIYEAGIAVINKCEQKIKSDDAIPFRNITEGETNKLEILRKIFELRKEECEVDDKILTQNDKKNLITILAMHIDEAENETLNRLKVLGSSSEARLLGRENLGHENLPLDVSETGKITLKSGSENFYLQDLDQLLQNYSCTESYRNGLGSLTDIHTSRSVQGRSKRYFVDFSNCKTDKAKEIKDALKTIDVAVVFNKSDGTYTDVTNNDLDGIRGRLYYDEVTKKAVREWDNNSANVGKIELDIPVPLCEGVTIREEGAIKASTSINLDAAKREKNDLNFGRLNLENHSGNPEDNPELRKYTGYFDNFENNELRNTLLHLGNDEYNRFIIATENKIRNVVQEAKVLGYTLQTPPVTNGGDGLMTIHFWDKDLKKRSMPIFSNRNNCELGTKLYDLIEDDLEDEYNSYLVNSIKSKREETDYLTVNDFILTNNKISDPNNSDFLKDSERAQILNGLTLLNELVNDMRENCGHSTLTRGDRTGEEMSRFINNAIYSISFGKGLSKREISEKIINVIKNDLFKYGVGGRTTETPKYLELLLRGESEEIQENAYRWFIEASGYNIGSRQGERIATSTDENGEFKIGVEDTKLNQCLKNINTHFRVEAKDINFTGENSLLIENNIKCRNISDLYDYAMLGEEVGIESIAYRLKELGIIPEEYFTYIGMTKHEINNRDIYEACKKIYHKLRDQNRVIKQRMPTENLIETEWRLKKAELEATKANGNIKPDGEQELQILTFYLENPKVKTDAINNTIKGLQALLRFEGINNIIYGSLLGSYGEISGGTIGEGSNIFNDRMGYGWFNLSDESSQILNIVAQELLITAGTRYVGGGLVNIGKATISVGRTAVFAGKLGKIGTKIYQADKKLTKLGKRISALMRLKYGDKIGGEIIQGTRKFGGEITKDAFEGMYNNIWNGKNIFDNFGEDVFKSAIKQLVPYSFLKKGIEKQGKKLVFNSERFRNLKNEKLQDFLKNNKMWDLASGLSASFSREVITHPIFNLTLGETTFNSEKGIEETNHRFGWNESITGNLVAIILSKAQNSTTWQHISSKIGDETVKFFFDRAKNNFVVKDYRNGKVVDINHLEDLCRA